MRFIRAANQSGAIWILFLCLFSRAACQRFGAFYQRQARHAMCRLVGPNPSWMRKVPLPPNVCNNHQKHKRLVWKPMEILWNMVVALSPGVFERTAHIAHTVYPSAMEIRFQIPKRFLPPQCGRRCGNKARLWACCYYYVIEHFSSRRFPEPTTFGETNDCVAF